MAAVRRVLLTFFSVLLFPAWAVQAEEVEKAAPLVIGETFTVESKALGETRRINVYLPPGYAEAPEARLPVLYMPDGGLGEDFLHIAGLVQISSLNGTMRPHVLVGIENTQRRRDLSGPTEVAEDRKVAPVVGGSAAFRQFLREELMPQVRQRYRTTEEKAIVGESLAGLFVIETFFLEPDLFDTYLAFDPSLWWNAEALVKGACDKLAARPALAKTVYFASSDVRDIAAASRRLAEAFRRCAPKGVRWHLEKMPEEKHSTIFHPAALRAFRSVFKPAPSAGSR